MNNLYGHLCEHLCEHLFEHLYGQPALMAVAPPSATAHRVVTPLLAVRPLQRPAFVNVFVKVFVRVSV